MAAPISFSIAPADVPKLAALRYEHPNPRVQRRCWVLWLVSQGERVVDAATVRARTPRRRADGGVTAF